MELISLLAGFVLFGCVGYMVLKWIAKRQDNGKTNRL